MKISQEVIETTKKIESLYPSEFDWLLNDNRTRMLWQIQTVVDNVKKGGNLVDIGGGIVPFMRVCQEMGYQTTIIDDFSDQMYQTPASETVLSDFRNAGMNILDGDAFSMDLDVIDGPIDMITSHDSMEHWHCSPKKMFHTLWEKTSKGGFMFIGVPNCVNLRKRLTVPFGIGKWSGMDVWYEEPVFRGHVREPDTGDLAYIAKDLDASNYKIVGQNWMGYRNSRPAIRAITPFVDKILQIRPSLCSDIYLFAWK